VTEAREYAASFSSSGHGGGGCDLQISVDPRLSASLSLDSLPEAQWMVRHGRAVKLWLGQPLSNGSGAGQLVK
jgi:hypothetical protein